MTKHAKEPWVVGPVDDTIVTHVGADGVRYEIAAVDGDYNNPDLWPAMEANARRIVDCVNALEGLNPAAVRGVVEILERLIKLGGSDTPDEYMVAMVELECDAATALAKLREAE